jgi:hypothetical protein
VVRTDNILGASQGGATYRWLDCNNLNNPVWGATEDIFTPVTPGLYAVEITKDGYTVISDSVLVTIVGVKEHTSESGIKLYPNPTEGTVTLHAPGNPERICIRDLTGRLLRVYPVTHPSPYEFSLPHHAGMYLVEVSFPGKREIVKVIRR